jgi:hypothetical protein
MEDRMAVHEVDITLPKREIGRADAIFDVRADGATLGPLHVSRGAVVWFPSGTTYGYKLSCKRFDELMQEHGSRTEAR